MQLCKYLTTLLHFIGSTFQREFHRSHIHRFLCSYSLVMQIAYINLSYLGKIYICRWVIQGGRHRNGNLPLGGVEAFNLLFQKSKVSSMVKIKKISRNGNIVIVEDTYKDCVNFSVIHWPSWNSVAEVIYVYTHHSLIWTQKTGLCGLYCN